MLEQPFFGQRLKQLRTERGLSQAALAGASMSAGYLSRLESGARQPTQRAVAHLVERLGVDFAHFDQPLRNNSLAQAVTVASTSEEEDAVLHLAEALEEDEDYDKALRWLAVWLLARTERRAGLRSQELAHLEELVALGEETGQPELRVRAHTQLARCCISLGNMDRALESATEAYHITRESSLSVPDTASVLKTLVAAEAEAGRLSDARAHSDELTTLVRGGRGILAVEALWTASTVNLRLGDHQTARELLERALEELDSHDGLLLWVRLRLAAASLYLRFTPPLVEPARERLHEITPVLALVGTVLHQEELTTLQARLAFHEGRFTDARKLIDELSDKEIMLSFHDTVRLRILHNQLLAEEGCAEEACHNLRILGNEVHIGSHIDLAAEIWRTLAELLTQKA